MNSIERKIVIAKWDLYIHFMIKDIGERYYSLNTKCIWFKP